MLLVARALLAALFLSGPALFESHAASPDAVPAAQADARAAASFIDSLGLRAIGSLTGPEITAVQRVREFRALLRDSFDLAYIGRFTLGRHWRQSTADQRSEYLRLFEDFIVQAYAHRFKDYAGETFVVDRSSAAGRSIFFVQSRIVRASQPPIRIDWRVRREGGGFRVVDVLVEGISMLITHRQEFASVIQNTGGRLEGLLAALRKRTAAN